MIDNELARNGSGYYDETALKAFMNLGKPGEIWSGVNGGEYLIVQKQKGFVNIVRLVDTDHPENMRIGGKYANPAMIQYLSMAQLGVYLRAIPHAELQAVIAEMRKRLTFVEVQTVQEIVKAEEKKVQKSRKALAHELVDLLLGGESE